MKEELYHLKELLDGEKSFIFAVTLFLIVNHYRKEILNQQAHFFSLCGTDCLGTMQYDQFNFAVFTGSVFTGLSSASESV